MKLTEFISSIGDTRAAKLFGVRPRTTKSWRLGDRTPRKERAAVIVRKSPVTYEGIYEKAA